MTLYERLGGQASIRAVVEEFYNIMLKDERVAHYFQTTDMKKQRQRQSQFIILVTGGPNKYQGGDMKTAHCKLAIGKSAFNATWENLQAALKIFNVPSAQTNELKQIFYSVESEVVNVSQTSIHQRTQKSLYDRLGGSQAVSLVVSKFYDFMLQDKRVAHYFANTDMQKQIKSQAEFITMVTGGPANYAGKDMKKAHCPYKIGAEEFNATWDNLDKALRHFSVGSGLINQVKDIFYSVQSDVVNYTKPSEVPSIHLPTTHQHHTQQYTQQMVQKCPHMSAKLSNFQSNHTNEKISQNEKRKLRMDFIRNEMQEKPKEKLSNCPYQKTFY